MRLYHLDEAVPWREILRIQRWHLEVLLRHLQRLRACGNPTLDIAPYNSQLQISYAAYRSLRSFLGYNSNTKIEQAVQACLKESL